MKEIVAYETEDGRIFRDELSAIAHTAKLHRQAFEDEINCVVKTWIGTHNLDGNWAANLIIDKWDELSAIFAPRPSP